MNSFSAWVTFSTVHQGLAPIRQVADLHTEHQHAEADEEIISSGRERKLHTAQSSCF